MGNQQVIDAVKLSIDNPDKYSMTYSSEPLESAVDGVYEGFSWYALVGIWVDSDSYVFSALPLDKWQNIAHLFSGDRGYGLVVLFQENMPVEF